MTFEHKSNEDGTRIVYETNADNIEDILQEFKYFLSAVSFSEKLLERIVYVEQ